MKPSFVQLTSGHWPSGDGKPIEHLDLEPEEISRRLDIEFSLGQDDLGEFLEAGIQTVSGRLLLFLRYTGIQAPGTTVLADSLDDAHTALRELNEILAI